MVISMYDKLNFIKMIIEDETSRVKELNNILIKTVDFILKLLQ